MGYSQLIHHLSHQKSSSAWHVSSLAIANWLMTPTNSTFIRTYLVIPVYNHLLCLHVEAPPMQQLYHFFFHEDPCPCMFSILACTLIGSPFRLSTLSTSANHEIDKYIQIGSCQKNFCILPSSWWRFYHHAAISTQIYIKLLWQCNLGFFVLNLAIKQIWTSGRSL